MKNKHTCQGSFLFASITICGPYADPLWRKLLTTYKYQSAYCLESVIEMILKRFRQELMEPWPWAGYGGMTLVPLPTDKKHIHHRGFDHALHLAESIRKILVPWAECRSMLKRTRRALAHANLPADLTRQANIQGVFEAGGAMTGPVLLIDDVFTTGATTNEAARALLNAGASAVHLFTLASG